MFVDGTLVFCKDSLNQITFLCWPLMWFEVLSSLKINLEKCELIPIGRMGDMEARIVQLGTCKGGSFPSSYLGLLLSTLYKSMGA